MVFKNLLEIFLTSINGVRVVKGLAFPSWPFVTLTYLHSLFELFPFQRNIFGAEMSYDYAGQGGTGDALLDISFELDRAHHSLGPMPAQGSQSIVVHFHRYIQKKWVQLWAKKIQSMSYQGYPARISPFLRMGYPWGWSTRHSNRSLLMESLAYLTPQMKRCVSTMISAVSENMTSLYTSPLTFLVLYENWTEVTGRLVCLAYCISL